MLRITIELVPFGIEKHKRVLAQAIIANDGTGTKTRGNYVAKFSQNRRPNRVWKKTKHKDFPRTRKGSWHLLYECLKEIME